MPGSSNLTPFELQIMQVLWALGPSTVTEVQSALSGEPAYTTVQTMLNILHRKGKTHRSPGVGTRAFRYRAAISRERAAGSTLRDLVQRMFGGDPNALLLTLLDTRQLTQADLTRLSAELAARDPEAIAAGLANNAAAAQSVTPPRKAYPRKPRGLREPKKSSEPSSEPGEAGEPKEQA